jgi:hypothetical protein
MKQRYMAFLGVAVVLVGLAAVAVWQTPLFGQSAAKTAPRAYTPSRTVDGQPDLQGGWANNKATPLERPKILEGRKFLNEQEVAALKKRAGELFGGDGDAAFGDSIYEAVLSDVKKYKPTTFDTETGNYNAFWIVERDFDNRTSLITDPDDGKLPPLTPAGEKLRAAVLEAQARGAADGPEDRPLNERCITFGMPDLLAGYNSYYRIFQTKNYVAINTERIHDSRIIPLDGRPHVGSAVKSWMGDSRGHWEGDTLVVETTNLSPQGLFIGTSDKLKVTERFTRIGPKTINYEVTMNDPATWTKPWTLMIPLKHTDEEVYEYACHEGNSGMTGILAGARALEKNPTSTKVQR